MSTTSNQSSTLSGPILVTGATGGVGRHVVARLRGHGVAVRALTRDPSRGMQILGPDVPLVHGDLADVVSVRAALDGVQRVYLACGNHPAQVEWESGLIDEAVAAGVQRVVKLSALDARIGSPVGFAHAHGLIERHLRAAPIEHVLLKPSFYMMNLLGAADGVRDAGAIFAPAAGAIIAMIDPRDVAAVAAVALIGEGHAGQAYELTGPAAVTFDDVAAQLSTILGRPIVFVAVPDEMAIEQFVASGVPHWAATGIVAQFGLLRAGTQTGVSNAVHALTGNRPREVAGFLRDHIDVYAVSHR